MKKRCILAVLAMLAFLFPTYAGAQSSQDEHVTPEDFPNPWREINSSRLSGLNESDCYIIAIVRTDYASKAYSGDPKVMSEISASSARAGALPAVTNETDGEIAGIPDGTLIFRLENLDQSSPESPEAYLKAIYPEQGYVVPGVSEGDIRLVERKSEAKKVLLRRQYHCVALDFNPFGDKGQYIMYRKSSDCFEINSGSGNRVNIFANTPVLKPKKNVTISFNPNEIGINYGDVSPLPSYAITESGTSVAVDANLTFSGYDNSVLSIENGVIRALKGSGETVVTASFAGDSRYNGAESSFRVLTYAVEPELRWSAESYSVPISAPYDLPEIVNPAGLPLTFSSTGSSVSVDVNGKITVNSVGSCRIDAVFSGNDNYKAKTVSVMITVKEREQVALPRFDGYSPGVPNSPGTGIRISSDTNGCEIRYTVSNGGEAAEPSEQSSLYLGLPVELTSAGMWNIKAKAYKEGYITSETASLTVEVRRESYTIVFSDTEVESRPGDTFASPAIVGIPSDDVFEIVYSSSDENVASVDGRTGFVTVRNIGTATIKAQVSFTDRYEKAEASYVVKVLAEITSIDDLGNVSPDVELELRVNLPLTVIYVSPDKKEMYCKSGAYRLRVLCRQGEIPYMSEDIVPGGWMGIYTFIDGVSREIVAEDASGFLSPMARDANWKAELIQGGIIGTENANNLVRIKSLDVRNGLKPDEMIMSGNFMIRNKFGLNGINAGNYDMEGIAGYESENGSMVFYPVSIGDRRKLSANLKFDVEEMVCDLAEGSLCELLPMSKDTDAVIHYDVEGEGVVIFDGNHRILPFAEGVAVILAEAEATDVYDAGKANYRIKVVDSRQDGETLDSETLRPADPLTVINMGENGRISIALSIGENPAYAPAYYPQERAFRLYEGNSMKFTIPEGDSLEKIILYQEVAERQIGDGTYPDVGDFYGVTWTNTDGNPVNEVTITNGSVEGFTLISGIKVVTASRPVRQKISFAQEIVKATVGDETPLPRLTDCNGMEIVPDRLELSDDNIVRVNSGNGSLTGLANGEVTLTAIKNFASGQEAARASLQIIVRRHAPVGWNGVEDWTGVICSRGDTSFPTLYNPEKLQTSCSSSDESVAGIDRDGNVGLTGVNGVSIITVRSDETPEYWETQKSYLLVCTSLVNATFNFLSGEYGLASDGNISGESVFSGNVRVRFDGQVNTVSGSGIEFAPGSCLKVDVPEGRKISRVRVIAAEGMTPDMSSSVGVVRREVWIPASGTAANQADVLFDSKSMIVGLEIFYSRDNEYTLERSLSFSAEEYVGRPGETLRMTLSYDRSLPGLPALGVYDSDGIVRNMSMSTNASGEAFFAFEREGEYDVVAFLEASAGYGCALAMAKVHILGDMVLRYESTSVTIYENDSEYLGKLPGIVCSRPELFSDIVYSSSDPEVASVDVSGRVTVNSCGETLISAYLYDGVEEYMAYYLLRVAEQRRDPADRDVYDLRLCYSGGREIDGEMIVIGEEHGVELTVEDIPEGAIVWYRLFEESMPANVEDDLLEGYERYSGAEGIYIYSGRNGELCIRTQRGNKVSNPRVWTYKTEKTDVSELNIETGVKYRLFTLDGIPVEDEKDLQPGVYIRIIDGKAERIIVNAGR